MNIWIIKNGETELRRFRLPDGEQPTQKFIDEKTARGWTVTQYVAPSPPAPTQRETQRAALRASWAAEPTWIRGPFDSAFRAAGVFLDSGDDQAAADLITYTDAPGSYVTDFVPEEGANPINQIAYFATLKQNIATAIGNLPPL